MPKIKSTEISKQIGEKVIKARKTAKLTQVQLGEKMGLSMQQIQKYESGLTSLSVERLFELANVLNIDPINLLTEINEPKSLFLESILELLTSFDKSGTAEEQNRFFKQVVSLYTDFRREKIEKINL